jgi:hypothetical protein
MKLNSFLTLFCLSFVMFGLMLVEPIAASAADVKIFRVLKVAVPADSSVDDYLKAEKLGDDTREIAIQLIGENNGISAVELFNKGGVGFLIDFFPDMKIFGAKGEYAYHVGYELPANFFGPEPDKLFLLKVLKVDVPAGSNFSDYFAQEKLENSAREKIYEITSSLNGDVSPDVLLNKGGIVFLVDFFPDMKIFGAKGEYAHHVSCELPKSLLAIN